MPTIERQVAAHRARKKAAEPTKSIGPWKTELVPVAELLTMAAPYNPRTMGAGQLVALRASIASEGFLLNIVANRRTRHVVGGHQRILAAEAEGIAALPVLWIDVDLTQEKRANLALNRIAGEFDDDLLARVLGDLHDAGPDMVATGFTDGELNTMMADAAADAAGTAPGPTITGGLFDATGLPTPSKRNTRAQPGDLWILGAHRVLVGDCRDRADVERVFGSARPALVLTDPPYCSGAFQEAGRAAGTWGDIASDSLSTRGWSALMQAWLTVAKPRAAYIFTDWRMWIPLFDVVESSGLPVRSMLTWDKGSPGLGSLWRTQSELICFASRDANRRRRGVRSVGNVLQASRTGNRMHYTEKPVDLLRQILANDSASDRGACDVFDPFLGSGSTLLAAGALGRRCVALEIEPFFVDVTVRRWEAATGERAERAEGGPRGKASKKASGKKAGKTKKGRRKAARRGKR